MLGTLWLSLGIAGTSVSASEWSSLWTTPEQRAQHLLDSGHPREAASLFSDPRRRAYADLRAGRYAAAVQLLKPLHDADSEYNRGNALARTGDLPAALTAYNAALAQAPGDRDVRHNRDLVESELRRGASQQSGRGGSQQKQGGAGQQGGSSDQRKAADARGSKGQGASGSGAGTPAGSQAGSSPSDSSAPGQDANQAKQDAALAASLRRNETRQGQSQTAGTGTARGSESAGGIKVAPGKGQQEVGPPPKSEQTLALEQWLRRIPDDPGGLLRRKFLIEYIERQQGSQPPQTEPEP